MTPAVEKAPLLDGHDHDKGSEIVGRAVVFCVVAAILMAAYQLSSSRLTESHR